MCVCVSQNLGALPWAPLSLCPGPPPFYTQSQPLQLATGDLVPYDLTFWFKARLTECLLGLDEDDYAIRGGAGYRGACLAHYFWC